MFLVAVMFRNPLKWLDRSGISVPGRLVILSAEAREVYAIAYRLNNKPKKIKNKYLYIFDWYSIDLVVGASVDPGSPLFNSSGWDFLCGILPNIRTDVCTLFFVGFPFAYPCSIVFHYFKGFLSTHHFECGCWYQFQSEFFSIQSYVNGH